VVGNVSKTKSNSECVHKAVRARIFRVQYAHLHIAVAYKSLPCEHWICSGDLNLKASPSPTTLCEPSTSPLKSI
jgi:hypothetical protein